MGKLRPFSNTTKSSISTTTTIITTTTEEFLSAEDESFLDQYIAKGFRLWMLLAIVLAILLVMLIITCCFIRIRIPRTKREIELIAAERKKRKPSKPVDLRNYSPPERGRKVIIMGSGSTNHLLLPPNGHDAESVSCTSCATSEHSRNVTPTRGSRNSLDQQSNNGTRKNGHTSRRAM